MNKRSIGIIGKGFIGSYVYNEIINNPNSPLEIAFVYDTDEDRLKDIPKELILNSIEDFYLLKPDMVCEFAHAQVAKDYGDIILQKTDFFILSVTALADRILEKQLKTTAKKSGTRLLIPHGGVMGLTDIIDGRKMWDEVSITMKKKPENLDFAYSGIDPATITKETVIYDGPTRDLCFQFPRNVNTHATLALGGIGLDKTHSVLISSPDFSNAVVDITANGGGAELTFHRAESIVGVTGTSTPWSVLQSILKTASMKSGFHFC